VRNASTDPAERPRGILNSMKKNGLRVFVALVLFQLMMLPLAAVAQTGDTADVYSRIRKEENENSKIMRVMHYLTDVYGPRLTGSENHVNAAKWAAAEMKNWGFDKAELEAWEFGHPGWQNGRNTGLMLSPQEDTLTYEVLAWTPSTKGPVTGEVVSLITPTFPSAENPQIKQGPTQAELTAYLDSMKAAVKGKMVLVGLPAFIDQSTEPMPKHIPMEQLKCRMDPTKKPGECGGPQFRGPQGPRPAARPGALNAREVDEQLDKFLLDNGALVRINESQLDRGAVRAFNNRSFDISKVIPTVVMRNEDFGRIYRILQDKTPVRLEFNLQSRVIPSGVTSYNLIGEIAGSDKKDEVIMLGGHLDSWHSATGATDNAIGCATMMEAARILKAIGVKPRRTIRVACWSGEEQGLLGSQAYVKSHFGSAEDPKPEFDKFGGYFNIDSGTGRVRAMTIFGPEEAAKVLGDALTPFEDLGFAGVTATKSRNLGGTDSTSFNHAGLPGIGGSQDPIEYFGVTWHTNLDTYERIIEPDAKASAIIFAAAVYTLAMRDELLPRFPKDQMPPLPQAPNR